MKKHTFSPDERIKSPNLSEGVSDQEERLWIYFHKILKSLAPAEVDSTLCQSCDFIFSNPRFTEQDIQEKYQTIDQLGFDQQRHQQKGLPKSKLRGDRILQLIRSQTIGNSAAGNLKILDYGGAEGYLLEPFIEIGYEGYLIDFIQYQTTHPNIQYLGRDLNALGNNDRFDVILLLHTLEHVVDPVGLLKGLGQYLKPGGLLYIEVPLGAWLEWEFLREPVTHLNFFSESSLQNCTSIAGLQTSFINTQWQWVTTKKGLCVNLIATNRKVNNPPTIKALKKQMAGITYYPEALRENFKYYTKLVAKHYLDRLRT